MTSLDFEGVVELVGANFSLGEVCLIAVFEAADDFTTSTRWTDRSLAFVH